MKKRLLVCFLLLLDIQINIQAQHNIESNVILHFEEDFISNSAVTLGNPLKKLGVNSDESFISRSMITPTNGSGVAIQKKLYSDVQVTDGLIAFYKFDGNLEDESNFNNDAQSAGYELVTDRFLKPLNAVYLNGEEQFIQVPGIIPLSDFPMSISMWLKPDDLEKRHQTIYRRNLDEKGIILNILDDGRIQCNLFREVSVGDDGSSKQTSHNISESSNQNTIQANKWTHLTIKVNANLQAELFLNGESVGMSRYSDSNDFDPVENQPDYFGSFYFKTSDSSNGNYYKGVIDNIRVYDRELSNGEINDIYDSESVPSGPTTTFSIDNTHDYYFRYDSEIEIDFTKSIYSPSLAGNAPLYNLTLDRSINKTSSFSEDQKRVYWTPVFQRYILPGDSLRATFKASFINGLLGTDGSFLDGDGDEVAEGSPADDAIIDIYIAQLSDMNTDGSTNLVDLIELRDAWKSASSTTFDIGPANGEAPRFEPKLDGKFDNEDIEIYREDWVWYMNTKPERSVLVIESSEFRSINESLRISPNADTLEILYNPVDQVSTVEIRIEFNEQLLSQSDIKFRKSDFLGNMDVENGSILLSHFNEVTNTLYLQCAFYSDTINQTNIEFGFIDGIDKALFSDAQQIEIYVAEIDNQGRVYIGEEDYTQVVEVLEPVMLVSPTNTKINTSISPTFEWNKIDQADDYQFQVSSKSDFSSLIFDSVLADTTLNLENALVHNTKYYWRVKAINDLGEGFWSDTFEFTTIIELPEIVTLISPNNNADGVSNSPSFVWNRASRATRNILQLSDESDFSSIQIDSILSDTSISLQQNLFKDTDYYWRVKAINDGGESEWSEIWTFKTVIEVPNISTPYSPENGADISTLQPSFIWSKAVRTNSYIFQLTDTQNFAYSLIDSAVTDTSFIPVTKLENTTKYYWRVKAIGSGGEGEWSEIFNFFIPNSVSIETEDIPIDYAISQNYPNPFNPTTQISYALPEATEVRLDVINMLGQQVATLVNEPKSAGRYIVNFDASQFSSGVYFYTIQAGEFQQTKKMLLIK